MLCSSPMSIKISSKVPIIVPSLAGRGRPSQAIMTKTPAVFNVTVFPPVFEPVMTRVEKSFPHEISIGTALSLKIGCLAPTRRKNLSFVNSGKIHFFERIRKSQVDNTSKVPIIRSEAFMAFSRAKIFRVSSSRINLSSSCSSLVLMIKLLLMLDNALGSM